MPNDPLNLYKEILLYILRRSSLSLPQSIALDVITALGYTDYIQAQSALGELIDAGLVNETVTYHRTYLSLTKTGEETCLAFEEQLSPDIRREIDEYFRENHVESRDETALVSDYRLTKDGMYATTCAIRDGSHTVYELTLEVSSEEEAIRICNAWEKYSEDVYAFSLKTLLRQI